MASATPPTTRPRFHDWTRDPLPSDLVLTPFQQLIRSLNWAESPLGLMRNWPNLLRQMVLLIVRDPAPGAVFWGEEQTIIYNEAYVEQAHPDGDHSD
jgi:hypothetical protein